MESSRKRLSSVSHTPDRRNSRERDKSRDKVRRSRRDRDRSGKGGRRRDRRDKRDSSKGQYNVDTPQPAEKQSFFNQWDMKYPMANENYEKAKESFLNTSGSNPWTSGT